jgi:hypothetical protein
MCGSGVVVLDFRLST